MKKKFEVGSVVTWGPKAYGYTVVEVREDGVIIDGGWIAPNHLVPWSENPVHTDMKPRFGCAN